MYESKNRIFEKQIERGELMAQLYYRYSTMNAGKSAEIIRIAHNYEERSKRVLTLMPSVDDRFGLGVITSRIDVYKRQGQDRSYSVYRGGSFSYGKTNRSDPGTAGEISDSRGA